MVRNTEELQELLQQTRAELERHEAGNGVSTRGSGPTTA